MSVGAIPTDIGDLKLVEYLLFGNNSLSSTIPSEIGGLDTLKDLNLSNNKLTGEIPSEMGMLSEVNVITLTMNSLTGTIPVQFASLKNLELFKYRENDIAEELFDNHVLCSLRDINGGALITLWADCDICLSCCSDDDPNCN